MQRESQLFGIKDEPGMAFKIFDLLAKKNINVDIIFTVDRS